MNLSKFYGKTIIPACQYCLYCSHSENGLQCDKGSSAAMNSSCHSFRYEPTMREPKQLPSLGNFQPEDFQI